MNTVIGKLAHLLKIFCWVPLVLGLVGYWQYGFGDMSFWRALYASAALYFINPVSDLDNVFVTLAEFLAIFVIASALLSALSDFWKFISHWMIRINKDATVVYSDSAEGSKIVHNFKDAYLVSANNVTDLTKIEKVKDHIVMFSDDQENLSFLARFKNNLAGKRAYLVLNTVDTDNLDETSSKQFEIHYLNRYEVIARDYWRTHSLFEMVMEAVKTDQEINVAIIGFDSVGKAIMKYAYLYNLFDNSQRINYHIWGCSTDDMVFWESLNKQMVNNDSLIIHKNTYKKDLSILNTMDRIIIAQPNYLEPLQTLIAEDPHLTVHCFYDGNLKLNTIFQASNITQFGNVEKLLTEANIKQESLNKMAKLFNADYELREGRLKNKKITKAELLKVMEDYWNELNGFTKGSNIACADHYEVRFRRKNDNYDPEQLRKLEHNRWCRYHYYHGWKYGERDKDHKIHNLLIPYEELPEKAKEKDEVFHPLVASIIEEILNPPPLPQ